MLAYTQLFSRPTYTSMLTYSYFHRIHTPACLHTVIFTAYTHQHAYTQLFSTKYIHQHAYTQLFSTVYTGILTHSYFPFPLPHTPAWYRRKHQLIISFVFKLLRMVKCSIHRKPRYPDFNHRALNPMAKINVWMINEARRLSRYLDLGQPADARKSAVSAWTVKGRRHTAYENPFILPAIDCFNRFLALLCATAQQSYCRHAGVRRPSSSVRRPSVVRRP